MGKGVAVEFKARWPAMYEAYKAECDAKQFQTGDVFVWEENGTTVFNLGTESHWRTGATLAAIETAAEKMIREAESRGITRIAMPRIGAGYGGLPWGNVEAALDRASRGSEVELVVVSLPK